MRVDGNVVVFLGECILFRNESVLAREVSDLTYTTRPENTYNVWRVISLLTCYAW